MTFKLTIFVSALLLVINGISQSGCTNDQAINFDPIAVQDDGSCELFTTSYEFDATLDIPINIGTGISNEHMTVANYGPLQIGAKINERFVDDVTPIGINYNISTGYSRTDFFDATPNPPLAKWDYIFSVDLGEYTYNDLNVFVSIDFDPIDSETQAESYELPLSELLQGIGLGGSSIRQQSENLGFAFWQGLAGEDALLFSPTQAGVYDLGLRVENQGGSELLNNFIRVVVDEAIEGCTNELACNYNPLANLNDNTCEFPEPFQSCDGTCEHDFNSNGVCDELEVYGCTYISAPNYNSEATADDGSCLIEASCLGDLDFNGTINSGDLLLFLTVYATDCFE